MDWYFLYLLMTSLENKLKNPVWYSLNETHKKFIITYDGVQFYHPDICTFGSFINVEKTAKALNEYSKLSKNFFLVSEHETPLIDSNTVFVEKKIEGCQMVLDNLVDIKITENIIPLTEKHTNEIYELIWLVMPGYYQNDLLKWVIFLEYSKIINWFQFLVSECNLMTLLRSVQSLLIQIIHEEAMQNSSLPIPQKKF